MHLKYKAVNFVERLNRSEDVIKNIKNLVKEGILNQFGNAADNEKKL